MVNINKARQDATRKTFGGYRYLGVWTRDSDFAVWPTLHYMAETFAAEIPLLIHPTRNAL